MYQAFHGTPVRRININCPVVRLQEPSLCPACGRCARQVRSTSGALSHQSLASGDRLQQLLFPQVLMV